MMYCCGLDQNFNYGIFTKDGNKLYTINVRELSIIPADALAPGLNIVRETCVGIVAVIPIDAMVILIKSQEDGKS